MMGYILHIVLTLIIGYASQRQTLAAADTALRLESSNRDGQINVNDDPHGYLISHWNYGDENYANNIDSSITLTGLKADQQVVINFRGFEIYTYPRICCCINDYLQISGLRDSNDIKYCSDNERSPPLGRYITLTVKRDEIKFKFVTNSKPGTRDDGFRLRYDVIPVTTTASIHTSVSDQMVTEQLGNTTVIWSGIRHPLTIGLIVGAVVIILIFVVVVSLLILRKRKMRGNKNSPLSQNASYRPEYSYRRTNDNNDYQLAYELHDLPQSNQVSEGDKEDSGHTRGAVTSEQSDCDKNEVELVDNELYG